MEWGGSGVDAGVVEQWQPSDEELVVGEVVARRPVLAKETVIWRERNGEKMFCLIPMVRCCLVEGQSQTAQKP